MNWKLFVTGPARKQLLRLPAKDRARVRNALLELQRDPLHGLVKTGGRLVKHARTTG
ncbi:MAG: hypothetical protein ABSC23_00240 [Bryobacteraceae bacterium]